MSRNSNMYDALKNPAWERYYTMQADSILHNEPEIEKLTRHIKYANDNIVEQEVAHIALDTVRIKLIDKENIEFFRAAYIKSSDVFSIINKAIDEAIYRRDVNRKDLKELEKQLEIAKLKEQVTALESKVKDLTPAF